MTSLKPKKKSSKASSLKKDSKKLTTTFVTLTSNEKYRLSLLYVISDFEDYNEFLKHKLFFDTRGVTKANNDSLAFYRRLTCLYQEFHVLAKSYSELVQNQDSFVYQQKELLNLLTKQTKQVALLSQKIINLIEEFKSANPLKDFNYDRKY